MFSLPMRACRVRRVLVARNPHSRRGKQAASKRQLNTTNPAAGGGFAFGQFALFATYSLAFWYGGQLVSKGESTFKEVRACPACGAGLGSTVLTRADRPALQWPCSPFRCSKSPHQQ